MSTIVSQQAKAQQFHKLHYGAKMLVLPNVWDPLGALLLQSLDYPAVATASASIAFANGYKDGEQIPFNDVLELFSKIVKNVNIPVTADIESGYASTEILLQENIKQLIATGIVGINIEDTDKETNTLFSIEKQCDRISLIKEISAEMGISLFINARTDVYIDKNEFNAPESKLEETLKRGLAYKKAGADCIFPLAIRQEREIKILVEQLQMPINVLTIHGIPELKILQEIGVARVSLGPSLLKLAVRAMKDIALKLNTLDGLPTITENEITSDYLNDLVHNKN